MEGKAASSRRTSRAVAPAALGLALLASLAAGLQGSRRPREILLDLGPGDGPFTSGFAPPRPESFDPYEIREGVATHWTTHEARIALPLRVEADAVRVRLRLARHFKDRGALEVRLAGQPLARFPIGGGYLDYEASSVGPATWPLVLDLAVEGRDDRGLGVSLDSVAVTPASGGRTALQPSAALRLPATIALAAAALLLAGASAHVAGALACLLAIVGGLSTLVDPWLTYRLLRGLPETLALLGLPFSVGLRALASRFSLPREGIALAASLLVAAFLLRGLALNRPDFYNPDYRMHAGLVEAASRAGLDVLRAPAAVLFTPREDQAKGDPLRRATSGLWLRRIGDQDLGLPYSLLPHALLAILPLDYDARLTALRTAGAFFSAVPAALAVLLAVRVGLSPWTAVLVAAAPAGAVELSLGSVPAMVGHALDVAVVLLLALAPPIGRRRIVAAALALAGAQLAYVSSTLLLPVLFMSLALLAAFAATGGRALARGLLLAAFTGSLFAFLVYYRDFASDALRTLQALAAPGPAVALADPGRDRVGGALLGWGFGLAPLLAAVGLVAALRRNGPEARGILPAWALAAAVLLALQAAAGGALGFLHLPLFTAPLLALLAGDALQAASGRGPQAAGAARLAALALAAHGFWLQWLAVRAERLGG